MPRNFSLPQFLAERRTACLLLTLVALFVHGYHPFAEDAGIYIPAIKKQLDPSLYPSGSEFFLLPARWSVFTHVVAASARIALLPLSYALLLWYCACLFITLFACWKIAESVFRTRTAGFVGASLVAVTISMPAAGSALLLNDPYLTARSVSTPLLLLGIAFLIENRNLAVLVCWLTAFFFHPLMAAIDGLFLLFFLAVSSSKWRRHFELLPFAGATAFAYAHFARIPVSDDYRAAAMSRSYFFLSQWAWYELIGAIAPVALFAWMAWIHRRQHDSVQFQLSVAVVLFSGAALVAAAAVTWIPSFFPYARFQPMRAYQLIYFLLLLVPLNAAGRWMSRAWTLRRAQVAFATVLLLLGSAMYFVQRQTFPASRHLEWPWSTPENSWVQAFDWIRNNTPKDAVFALDSDYPNHPGNDRQGFRAAAERSALPDAAKDGGVAALFPQIACTWKSSTDLTSRMDRLDDEQRNKLLQAGATWVLGTFRSDSGLDCPYSNRVVSVCRLTSESYSARLKSGSAPKP